MPTYRQQPLHRVVIVIGGIETVESFYTLEEARERALETGGKYLGPDAPQKAEQYE